MHSFDDFNDYRVCAWTQNGLLKRIESVFETVKASARSVVSAVAFGVAVAASTTVAYSSHLSAPTWTEASLQVQDHNSAVSLLHSLREDISSRLAALDSDTQPSIDPQTLALAQQAVEAVAARGDINPNDWAANLVKGNA